MKQLYNWCKSHSIISHIIGATLLAQSYFVFGVVGSLLFSSVFFIGKEFLDRKTTGFGWVDLLVDYVAWSFVTMCLTLI